MYNKGFHFEIHDLLTQFIAAMDDVVISRYNSLREEKEQIKVRYVHAPKERVLYDIINKAQNITVPVISVNVTGLQRDESRVFNKVDGMFNPVRRDIYSAAGTAYIPMPVPVNVSVSLNIITNYQSDLDQIISNFVPYSNPYIIITWRVPDTFGLGLINEIRSEVLWDGSINLEYPTDVTAADKPRFIGSTTFIIKGWLFPAAPNELVKNIFFIDSNFHVTSKINLNYDSYLKSLTADNYVYDPSKGLLNELEVVSISAAPLLTNLYLNTSARAIELSGSEIVIDDTFQPIAFTILGQNFQYTKHVLLSSDSSTIYTNVSSLSFTYYPNITAFDIPNEYLTILNKNSLHVNLPPLTGSGNINLIVANSVGWQDTNSIDTKILYLSSVKAGTGSYWFTNTSINNKDKWQTISSWYVNSDHTFKAILLPNNNTDVIIDGSIGPIADLDRTDWVQPKSINSGITGVTFTSQTNQTVTIPITGNVTFLGNASYNI